MGKAKVTVRFHRVAEQDMLVWYASLAGREPDKALLVAAELEAMVEELRKYAGRPDGYLANLDTKPTTYEYLGPGNWWFRYQIRESESWWRGHRVEVIIRRVTRERGGGGPR